MYPRKIYQWPVNLEHDDLKELATDGWKIVRVDVDDEDEIESVTLEKEDE